MLFTGLLFPKNVRLAEAPSYGVPVHFYDKYSKGSRAYLALAGEVLNRHPEAADKVETMVNKKRGLGRGWMRYCLRKRPVGRREFRRGLERYSDYKYSRRQIPAQKSISRGIIGGIKGVNCFSRSCATNCFKTDRERRLRNYIRRASLESI